MIKYRNELPSLMKRLGLPMVAAELGVAEGYNSADLLDNGIEKLYMVDAWETLPQRGDGGFPKDWHESNLAAALKRVSKHGDKAVILRGYTNVMAKEVEDNSLGLVYIDADHSYAGCRNDVLAWWPKLVKGGIMAFHDYEMRQYGVKEAVQEWAREHKLEVHLIPENKPEDAGAWIIKN